MKGRPWTKREEAYLRRHAALGRLAAIAAALGRSYTAVKARAHRLGVRTRRRWTSTEAEYLAAHYSSDGAPAVARALGRSRQAVHTAAKARGLARARTPLAPDFAERVRALHARGWSDAEIAAALGCERHTVGDRRRVMGLGSNAFSEHRRRKVAARTREQVAAAGLRSLGEVRVAAFRAFAREHGWPEDLRPRAVRILNALWTHGPMTRRQLAGEIGMPWKGSRKSLVSNDPEGSYLAHLMKRGLVVSLGRIVKGKGRGGSVHLYSLPLGIERKVGG